MNLNILWKWPINFKGNFFPAHFRHLFIQFKKQCAFNFVPDILESANARFKFVCGRSILKHRHSISCFVTHFRQLQSNSSVTVAEHETANSISSIGIHFRQSFTQNRLPDIKAHITIDEFEWQNSEVVWQNDEFDPSIPYSLSGRDEFQWQLTNLNA